MGGLLANNILTRALWGDEAWTTLISSLPWFDLVKTTAADFHPPLYYTIIHFWMQFFGNSEISIRAVSLIFWLLSGLAIFFFTRSLRFSIFYLLSSIFFVLFNPFIFLYAFEARNYTLFVFLSIVSVWQFYEIVKKPSRLNLVSCILYLVSSVAGLYTHYYSFFLLAAQGLYVLLLRRNLLRLFCILYLVSCILYLPWLPIFLSQTKSVAAGYWVSPIDLGTIIGTLAVIIRGEQQSIFFYLLPPIFLIYLLSSIFFGLKNRRLFSSETALFLLWFLVPFIVPLLLSFFRPIFFYRYLIPTTIPLMLLPLFWLAKGKKLFLLPVAFLAVYFYSDALAFTSRTDQLFKPILAKIHQEAKPGDSIYTVLPSFAEVVYYNNYDKKPLPIKVLPLGLQQASGKALLDTYVQKGYLTIENFPKRGRYWYLEPGPRFTLVNNF